MKMWQVVPTGYTSWSAKGKPASDHNRDTLMTSHLEKIRVRTRVINVPVIPTPEIHPLMLRIMIRVMSAIDIDTKITNAHSTNGILMQIKTLRYLSKILTKGRPSNRHTRRDSDFWTIKT
jgi:hypothetical protein